MATYAYLGEEFIKDYVKEKVDGAGYLFTNLPDAADIVFVYSVDAEVHEDYFFGSEGLTELCRQGAVLVDLSPATITEAQEIAAVAQVSDMFYVEAPLAFNEPCIADPMTTQSNITCFAAGDQAALGQVLPALEALAGTVRQCGPLGSAQLARAEHTIWMSSQIMAAVEVRALYDAVLTDANSLEPIEGQPTAQTALHKQVLEAIAAKEWLGDYNIAVFGYEVETVMDIADELDVILPQIESIDHMVQLLGIVGGPEKTPATMYLLYDSPHNPKNDVLNWGALDAFMADHMDEVAQDFLGEYLDDYDEDDAEADAFFGAFPQDVDRQAFADRFGLGRDDSFSDYDDADDYYDDDDADTNPYDDPSQ